VAQLDAAAAKAIRTVAAGERDFSDLGLDGAFGQALLSAHAVGAQRLVVAFDTTNATQSNPGVTHGLIPRYMTAKRAGTAIVVTVNQQGNGVGCGRQVQYALDPSGARRDETACRDRVAARMRSDEQSRRDRAVADAQNDNARAQEQHSREQQSYQRELQKHQEELLKPCGSCSGKRLQKCNYCNGKGTTTNNKNVSTCRICNGRTQVDCSSCSGTGLRHPRGCNPPRPPGALRLKDIPTFGSMPDYVHQI
jgi:hypothetical protein